MNRDECQRVSVNYCLSDEELGEARALVAGADAGEWRVREGRVERYSKAPFEKLAGSLALMAASVSLVPRLLRGVEALEAALRSAWLEARSAKSELAREREERRQDAERRAKGQTGPEGELTILLAYLELEARWNALRPSQAHRRADYEEGLLRRWAGGQSFRRELSGSLDSVKARVEEAETFDAQYAAEERAKTEDLRGRMVAAIDDLAAGRVPEELQGRVAQAKRSKKRLTGAL